MKGLLFILLMTTSIAQAQEHLYLRLNHQGIMNVLHMAVKYNTNAHGSRNIIIPENLYKFTLKKKDLLANPIVSAVNELSNLNLNKNLDFYLHTSEIKIVGVVDQKSLKVAMTNSRTNGFDVKVSISLPSITVTGGSLGLCEDRLRRTKKCGTGLKSTITNLQVNTKNKPIYLNAIMRVSVKGHAASVKVLSVSSNIEAGNGPDLGINFQSVEVPKLSIIINDQETELDTSKLKEVILKQRSVLAHKLLSFVGDFIASDLAEMMNVYLSNIHAPTAYDLYKEDEPNTRFDELDNQYDRSMPIDNTYVRPPVIMYPRPVSTVPAVATAPAKIDPKVLWKKIRDQISDIIYNAQASVSMSSLKTPLGKDIEIGGALSLMLNEKTIVTRNRLGNKDVKALPKLDLSSFRDNDINLALSESVINGALDLINETGMYQEIFNKLVKLKGFSIKNVQMHFTPEKNLKLVANVEIDLNKVDGKDWIDSIKNYFAALLESRNNNSKIYFPLEAVITPTMVKRPDGTVGISVYIASPFDGQDLVNSYGYPSNFSKLSSLVKDGIFKKLQKSINPLVNKTYEQLEITQFINKSKVTFTPKSISFEQGAYLLLNLDIADIKFSSIVPKKKK